MLKTLLTFAIFWLLAACLLTPLIGRFLRMLDVPAQARPTPPHRFGED